MAKPKTAREATKPGEPVLTVVDQIDRELAATALAKRRAGEKPTGRELAALRRAEAARATQLRWQHYRSIPKRDWQTMSGRQVKVINEQAHRYGLPLLGRTIDLPAVVAALHDFLASNKHRLAGDGKDGRVSSREADRRYKQARAEREERKNQEEAGLLVTLEELKRNRLELIEWFVSVLEELPALLAPTIAGKVLTMPTAQAAVRKRISEHRNYLVALSDARKGDNSNDSDTTTAKHCGNADRPG